MSEIPDGLETLQPLLGSEYPEERSRGLGLLNSQTALASLPPGSPAGEAFRTLLALCDAVVSKERRANLGTRAAIVAMTKELGGAVLAHLEAENAVVNGAQPGHARAPRAPAPAFPFGDDKVPDVVRGYGSRVEPMASSRRAVTVQVPEARAQWRSAGKVPVATGTAIERMRDIIGGRRNGVWEEYTLTASRKLNLRKSDDARVIENIIAAWTRTGDEGARARRWLGERLTPRSDGVQTSLGRYYIGQMVADLRSGGSEPSGVTSAALASYCRSLEMTPSSPVPKLDRAL